MGAAELIDLVMNFVIYPCLIIVHAVIQKCIIYKVLVQPVDNLNMILKYVTYRSTTQLEKEKTSINNNLILSCATHVKRLQVSVPLSC